jgi:hypothetical protein
MPNPHGTPIWYELLTPDHQQAKRFYDAVAGWEIGPKPDGEMDYRMIAAADGQVGGVMELTEAMTTGGARPGWQFYIGVDDVDATADRITAAGGAVLMPPFDLPGVGRVAFVADPGGAPFYIMRGASDAESTVFAPTRPGHFAWNELWTGDAAQALAFYAEVFGWDNRETMPIGPTGGYHFIDLGGVRLGAVGQAQTPDKLPRWTFYVQVPDLAAAIEQVSVGGGSVNDGPHDVPGGSRVIIGTDAHGATFALVGPGNQESIT